MEYLREVFSAQENLKMLRTSINYDSYVIFMHSLVQLVLGNSNANNIILETVALI